MDSLIYFGTSLLEQQFDNMYYEGLKIFMVRFNNSTSGTFSYESHPEYRKKEKKSLMNRGVF